MPAQPLLLGLLLAAASQKNKQFNLEAWEKETLNTISFKKNTDNKKAEKYYTNEEINKKHRSPNKREENMKATWEIIQNNDSKDNKKNLE